MCTLLEKIGLFKEMLCFFDRQCYGLHPYGAFRGFALLQQCHSLHTWPWGHCQLWGVDQRGRPVTWVSVCCKVNMFWYALYRHATVTGIICFASISWFQHNFFENAGTKLLAEVWKLWKIASLSFKCVKIYFVLTLLSHKLIVWLVLINPGT